MDKKETKNNIVEAINGTSLKSITLEEIYAKSKELYSPEMTIQIKEIINELIAENLIEPIKASKKNQKGMYLKYRIIKNKRDYAETKAEISKLHPKINIQYYLKHPEEYEKNKEDILKINSYITNQDKGQKLTVNERSYEVFKDEKKLKNCENILKKLGITFSDLNAYETYEPFFYFENTKYDKNKKRVLIIENRDTFWSFKKTIQENNNFYLVIYGEGKKILNSFKYIENFNLDANTEILYFGDIDYEGINIYISLSKKYSNYNILPYVKAYSKMLELENNPNKVKNDQNINKGNIETFLKYFSNEEDIKKLEYIFENKLYIPQEIINYNEVEKI